MVDIGEGKNIMKISMYEGWLLQTMAASPFTHCPWLLCLKPSAKRMSLLNHSLAVAAPWLPAKSRTRTMTTHSIVIMSNRATSFKLALVVSMIHVSIAMVF
jgi:hypothetical protein